MLFFLGLGLRWVLVSLYLMSKTAGDLQVHPYTVAAFAQAVRSPERQRPVLTMPSILPYS